MPLNKNRNYITMKTRIGYLFILLFTVLGISAQPKGLKPQIGSNPNEKMSDSWQITVNTMDMHRRQKITELVEDMQERGGTTRSIVFDLLNIAKTNSVTAAIDIVSTEIINWANYRKTRKSEWMRMIERENSYTDSISSIEGLYDFYSETSRYGALDPSHINFNGISVRGVHKGKEFIYLSCHIDTTRLDHLFRHSKFYLVVDSIVFKPYECHLPNLNANGIRVTRENESERNNQFSFDEREFLSFGMDLEITSSWINEAVMLHQNVSLGSFKLKFNIPSGVDVYKYSRKEIITNHHRMKHDSSLRLDTTLIHMEGDCFVVPRSYMPISGTEPMWGTGAYNFKVRFNEKCQFVQNPERNEKLRKWHSDYKRLRKLQKKNKGVWESVRNLWQQNGNTMIKTIVKQYLTNTASAAGLTRGADAATKLSGNNPSGNAGGNGGSTNGSGKGSHGSVPSGK